MAFRPDIIAGRAVIVVSLQETIEKELRRLRTQFRRFANTFSELGGDLFRFGLAGTAGSILPVKDFINFQDQLLFLQTKLQATDRDMTGLIDTILRLGRTTPFTPSQVAQAATEFAKAGFSIREIQDSLRAALDLARGGQVDLSTATAILANNIRTFQIDTSKAAEVASKFITAARLGTLDIVDLNESLKESSGTFRLLGIPLERALALITQISLSSLKATKAGTSLNTALINLSRRADDVSKIVGIQLTDADFERPLILLTKLDAALRRMSKIEQIGVLNELTNIRGARAVTSILIQGLGRLDSLQNSIAVSIDEARTSAEKLDSRLGGVFRRGLSAFQEFVITAGSTTEGPLTRFGEALTKVFRQLSELAKANPEVVQTLFLIPPAALVAGTAMLALSFALSKVALALSPVITLNQLLFDSIHKFLSVNLGALARISTIPSLIAESRRRSAKEAAWVAKETAYEIAKAAKKQAAAANAAAAAAKEARRERNRRGLGTGSLVSQSGKGPATTRAVESVATAAERARATLKAARIEANRKGSILGTLSKPSTPARTSLSTGETAKNIEKTTLALRRARIAANQGLGHLGARGGFLRLDFGRMLANLAKGLRSVLTTLTGIRRVFTGFSPLLIIEAIILFGDKLPGISRSLQVLGDGFKKLGQGIKNTFESAIPAFETIGIGFNRLFRGDLIGGVRALKAGLLDLVAVIRTGLTKAWADFLEATKPLRDRISAVFTGVLGTLNAIFEVIRSILGLIGQRLPGGSGGTEALLSDLTDPGAIRSVFAGIQTLIREVGVAILTLISDMADVLKLMKDALFSILRALSIIPGTGAQDILDTNDPNVRLAQINQLLRAINNPSAVVAPPEGMSEAEYVQSLAEERQGLLEQLKEEGRASSRLEEAINRLRSAIETNTNQPGGPSGDPEAAAAAAAAAARETRNTEAFQEWLTGALRAIQQPLTIPSIPFEVDPFAGQEGLTLGQSLTRAIAQRLIAQGNVEVTDQMREDAERTGMVITEAMRKHIVKLFGNETSLPEIASMAGEYIQKIFESISDFILGGSAKVDQAAADQVKQLKRDTASVVGSFSNTRGQLLKSLGENNKKRDKHLENLDNNLADVINGPNFV